MDVLLRMDPTQTYNFETYSVLVYKPMLLKKPGRNTGILEICCYNSKLFFIDVKLLFVKVFN